MSGERFVVLGLAHVRSDWFRSVAQWSSSAMVPVEFIKCVSVNELRARLASGRPHSAVLIDGGITGLDRDLIEQARTQGCVVVAIDDRSGVRDLHALGVVANLPESFGHDLLLATLADHAIAIGETADRATADAATMRAPDGWRGRSIVVTGAGGTGSSTAAIAIASGLAADVRTHGRVLLADLALDADQAMLHHARDIVPGVQELAEAFRHGSPAADEIVSMTFAEPHGYRLLLGLRRHRDWTALRPNAFAAAFDALVRTFTHVVADVELDLEGEQDVGSFDVEDRNGMARTAVANADLVVVTALPGVHGIHRLVRNLLTLHEHQISLDRVAVVINRAPRSARSRAEITRAIAHLAAPSVGSDIAALASPLFVPDNRKLDSALLDAAGVPASFVGPLTSMVTDRLHRLDERTVIDLTRAEPVAIAPGSLGAWAEDAEAVG